MNEPSSSNSDDDVVVFSPLIAVVNAIQDNSTNSQPEDTLFDRFLRDLVRVDTDSKGASPSSVLNSPEKRRMTLFREGGGDQQQDYDSDEDDAVLQEQLSGASSHNHYRSPTKSDASRSNSPFFRKSSLRSVRGDHATSYLSAQQQQQDEQHFFSRARILSVSDRYGFPPSKDPEGTNNLAYAIQTAYQQTQHRNHHNPTRAALLQQAASTYPIQGMVGTGWAEKHIHALPSVLLLVCTVSSVPAIQTVQDRKLMETIEHLQYSLVPKRQCAVQIVGLLLEGTDSIIGQQWSSAIALEQDHPVMALHPTRADDVQRLQTAIQEASLTYYLRQARRTKEKLYALLRDTGTRSSVGSSSRGAPPPVQLSPSIVRYCHKIAVFYEFQQRPEKSLRFMHLGYRQLGLYFGWVQSEDARPKKLQIPEEKAASKQPPSTAATQLQHQATMDDESGGVEIELGPPKEAEADDDDEYWTNLFPPLHDAVFQCRAVAHWFNLRLLTSGLASRTEGGVLAASQQWQNHFQLFLASPPTAPWHAWSFAVQQRCLWSRLVEQHYTHMALSKAQHDTVAIRCSPWRAYQAAAEATLRLACELGKDNTPSPTILPAQRSNDRPRYMGGRSSPDTSLPFEYASCRAAPHREQALELILKAVQLFEQEQQQLGLGLFYAADEMSERSSCRTGAHLYYLAGGILLGMQRFAEAAAYLTKGCQYARGWRKLELGLRRMLIECYEHMEVTPDDSSGRTSSGQALASMILDSYFNTDMSSSDLRRALDHFSTMSGGGNVLKWHHETHEEEDLSLPFCFALTFPGQTHATSGDTVAASVLIKSNLDYAVHVNSVTLATLAGSIPIPANDLMAASNASEGTGNGVIIQAKTSIIISTNIELPRDVSMIAFDESGNGGELQGIAGKGSFAKNAKPRTAGITSAGTYVLSLCWVGVCSPRSRCHLNNSSSFQLELDSYRRPS